MRDLGFADTRDVRDLGFARAHVPLRVCACARVREKGCVFFANFPAHWLQVLLKNAKFSPLYWAVRHNALIDCQRQLGYPTLFFTISPYEWSFPQHDYVLDEMAKAYVSRLHLPAAETLHMVTVFKEIVRGALTGWNQRNDNPEVQRARLDRTWTEHSLSCKDGSGRSTVVTYFGRFEFQDGKRKEGTQKYHGRGSPHLHILIWLENIDAIKLEEQLSATVPKKDDAFTTAYVLGDATTPGKSACQVHEGKSGWDEEDCKFRLHHSEEDYCDGRRAYFLDFMEALKCHQDVQITDSDREGRWILGRYVGTYVAKFSDSMAQDMRTRARNAARISCAAREEFMAMALK